jgi:anti-sigma factor RsiW
MRLTPDFELTLRRYVLGELEEGLRLELEELLLTDADAFEALGVIEDEMIEEYLEGTGTAEDRRAFEQSFLDSRARQQRLDFARALRARASRKAPRMSSVRPLAWIGLAALLVMSVGTTVLMRTSAPQTSPPVAMYDLAGGLIRAGGSLPRVVVPAGAVVVELRVELPSNDYSAYRAAVLDEDGKEVWSASKLGAKEQGGTVAIVLPVASTLLPPGDYRAKLSGVPASGDPEALGSYPFRVTRE